MNTKDKGDLAEVSVVKRVKELGYTVSIPFGDNAPYDLIYDDGQLHKVQVKYGRLSEGKVKAKLERTQRNQGRHAHKPYDSSEVDEFAIYCPGTDEVYRISVTDGQRRKSIFVLRKRRRLIQVYVGHLNIVYSPQIHGGWRCKSFPRRSFAQFSLSKDLYSINTYTNIRSG